MKKLLPLIILACSLAAFGQMQGHIKVATAILRSRPAEKAPALVTIRRGSKIRILPGKEVSGWTHASFGRTTGWIRTGTFSADPANIATTNEMPPPRMDMRVGVSNREDNSLHGGSTNTNALPDDAPPPPTRRPPVKSDPRVIDGGVINGKAVSLPKPAYPPAARAVNATGTVNVQVLIDEQGNVISATAVSGHPLLRQASVEAARNAKFSPTLLSGEPVKVSGIITYNFVP